MSETALQIQNAGSDNVNPPRKAFLITPDSNNDLAVETRAIKVGNTAGNLIVIMADARTEASPITIPVQAGDWLPIQVRRVLATSTASTLIGFY